jgi:hypothetical protein
MLMMVKYNYSLWIHAKNRVTESSVIFSEAIGAMYYLYF